MSIDVSPEKKLWTSVLRLAVLDAETPSNTFRSEERLREKAVEYLTQPSDDLKIVCIFAGMEPEALIARSRDKYLKEEEVVEDNRPEEFEAPSKGVEVVETKKMQAVRAFKEVFGRDNWERKMDCYKAVAEIIGGTPEQAGAALRSAAENVDDDLFQKSWKEFNSWFPEPIKRKVKPTSSEESDNWIDNLKKQIAERKEENKQLSDRLDGLLPIVHDTVEKTIESLIESKFQEIYEDVTADDSPQVLIFLRLFGVFRFGKPYEVLPGNFGAVHQAEALHKQIPRLFRWMFVTEFVTNDLVRREGVSGIKISDNVTC